MVELVSAWRLDFEPSLLPMGEAELRTARIRRAKTASVEWASNLKWAKYALSVKKVSGCDRRRVHPNHSRVAEYTETQLRRSQTLSVRVRDSITSLRVAARLRFLREKSILG